MANIQLLCGLENNEAEVNILYRLLLHKKEFQYACLVEPTLLFYYTFWQKHLEIKTLLMKFAQ